MMRLKNLFKDDTISVLAHYEMLDFESCLGAGGITVDLSPNLQ